MDFRLCPSCKQSVLDDEATECPFCGAGMSGKGGAAVKKSPAAKPAEKPATKSAPTKQPVASKQTKPTTETQESVEVDPFAVDPKLRKNTPKGLANPTKSCTHPTTCPMCGTLSYVPVKYVGRDIRCLNDACLVGVFKVPLIEQKVVEVKKPSFFQQNWIWMTVATIVLGGCITAYILIEQSNERIKVDLNITDNKQPDKPAVKPENQPVNTTTAFIDDPNNLQNITEENLLGKLLKELPNETKLASTADYKAASLQMLVLIYIKLGDIPQAEATLKTLADNTNYSPTFSIHPFVELAFYHLMANQPKVAESYIGKALNAWNVSSDDWHGRYAAVGAIQLMAGLVATNRLPDAEKVFAQLEEANKNKDQVGIESAALQTAFDLGYLDILIEETKKLPLDLGDKPGIAVVRVLELKGQPTAALSWCDAAKKPANKLVRKLELMRTKIFTPNHHSNISGQNIKLDAALPLIESLEPLEQTLAWAHLGRLAHQMQQPDLALKCLSQTENAMKSWQSLPQIELPDLLDIYYNKFDHQTQQYRATVSALAMCEYAILEQGLLKTEAAWNHFLEAVNLAKLASPDYDLLTAKINELDKSSNSVKIQLEDKLKTKSAQSISLLTEYRGNLQTLKQEILFSQQLLSRVMIEAMKSGLHEQAYEWFKQGAGKELNDKGYVPLEVPGAFWIAMFKIKDENRMNEFAALKLADKAKLPVDWDALTLADENSRAKKFKLIADTLDKTVNKQDQLATILTTMYVAKRYNAEVFMEWLKEVRSNNEYREKILQYGGAMYAINGKGVNMYNTFINTTPKTDEKLFAIRGVVQGLLQKGVKPEAQPKK